MFVFQGGPAWLGPVIAWLVAEAYDLLAVPTTARIEDAPALPAVSVLE